MHKVLLGFIAMVISVNVNAIQISPVVTDVNKDDRAYVGLKWALGGTIQPEVVVGLRSARTQKDGDTDGGDVSLSMQVFEKFQFGKLRAKVFGGGESVQGEVSGGYDFTNGLFMGLGAKAPYTTIGVDYLPQSAGNFVPYFMLDTLPKNDKPKNNPVPNPG